MLSPPTQFNQNVCRTEWKLSSRIIRWILQLIFIASIESKQIFASITNYWSRLLIFNCNRQRDRKTQIGARMKSGFCCLTKLWWFHVPETKNSVCRLSLSLARQIKITKIIKLKYKNKYWILTTGKKKKKIILKSWLKSELIEYSNILFSPWQKHIKIQKKELRSCALLLIHYVHV